MQNILARSDVTFIGSKLKTAFEFMLCMELMYVSNSFEFQHMLNDLQPCGKTQTGSTTQGPFEIKGVLQKEDFKIS